MTAFLVLLRVRLLDVLRNKSSVGFVLVFPVVLLITLGLVFMNGHPFERRYVALVDAGPRSELLERAAASLASTEEVRVGREPTEAIALGKLRSRMATAVIVAPSKEGDALTLRVGERDRIFGSGLVAMLPKPARLEVVAGPRFGYIHYLFPGILAFSVLTAGLFGMGYPMALFRQNLFLKKLATTPLPKVTFVAANVVARGALVLVEVLLLLVVARFAFDLKLSWLGAALSLGIAMLGAFVFLGVGFALATAIRNAELLVDVISALNLPLVFFSEIFFPLESLPTQLALVGSVLPSTQMVRLLRSVMLYGVSDVASLAPGLVLMMAWGVVTFAISLRVFKWHE